MSEITQVIHQIEKGKNVDYSLAVFANRMAGVAARLSAVRVPMNFDLFYENFREDETIRATASLADMAGKVRCAASDLFTDAKMTSAELEAVRLENIELMRELSACSDVFVLYEYILNRIEYRFREPEVSVSDEIFVKKVLNYITSGEDASMVQYNAVSVVAQLPFRMAKGRFLQTLEDGLSVYTSSERSSFEGVMQNLREAALLVQPEGLREHFPELWEICDKLKGFDDKTADEESYKEASALLVRGFELLNPAMDTVLLYEELLNDCCVSAMCASYSAGDAAERDAEGKIVAAIEGLFADASLPEIPESLNELFDSLVGKQETLYEVWSEGSGALPEITESRDDRIAELKIGAIYEALRKVDLLLSGSHFADLDEVKDSEPVGEEGIEVAYREFSENLLTSFSGKGKLYKRAVMSRILTSLPLFLRDYSELSAYVADSITGCLDEAEKAGSVEVLNQLMNA